MTLGDIKTTSRANNLTFIRLTAAIMVTAAHSIILLTGKNAILFDRFNTGNLGSWAVAIFFGLSGYLITQSYIFRKSWIAYFEARCLRIFPGLIFANFITVLLVSLAVKKQGWRIILDGDNWGYLIGGTIFKFYNYGNVFSTLATNSPNGSLWTLPIEFRMYIFILVAGSVGFFKRNFIPFDVLPIKSPT